LKAIRQVIAATSFFLYASPMKQFALFALTLFSRLAWSLDPSTCALTLGGAAMYKPLPVLKQDVNGKCGPTSLAIAAAYFGRAFQLNPYNPLELPNRFTAMTLTTANAANLFNGAPDCMKLNSGESLAATARVIGLNATAQYASLAEIAGFIRNQEVVLVHWWMGPDPLDYHWSPIQALASSFISLRDPWPTSPAENVQPLEQFQFRTLTGIPGTFPIVRVSSNPLY
jgi:hypothetical protein